MQTNITAADKREAQFAKLFTFEQQQVLAYLYRDDNDDLVVAIQVWVALTDEQLRAQISAATEALTMEIFDGLNQDTIEEVVRQLGIPEIIKDLG